MTREAARRLRSAKAAAAAVRARGGSQAEAAAAAQAFGAPCDDGSGSDSSNGSESADETDKQASGWEAKDDAAGCELMEGHADGSVATCRAAQLASAAGERHQSQLVDQRAGSCQATREVAGHGGATAALAKLHLRHDCG